jgi:hypothetical protein
MKTELYNPLAIEVIIPVHTEPLIPIQTEPLFRTILNHLLKLN